MKIKWIEERQGLWAVIGVLVAITFGLATSFRDDHSSSSAHTDKVRSDAKIKIYKLTAENGTIFDEQTGLTFSLSLVDTSSIKFYKLIWSTDSGSGSEAVKKGSSINIESIRGYFQVNILSVNKNEKSLLMRINKKV